MRSTTILTLLSISSIGVLAIPAEYKPNNADPVKLKQKRAAAISVPGQPLTKVPVTWQTVGPNPTLGTIRSPVGTATFPVYTLPTTTPPFYTLPTTTPGYGYSTPPTTLTSKTSATKSTSSSSSTYTPVVGANSTCANRLKIEVLQKTDPDQFNMLLLAWQKVQTDPDSNPFGHYQLAGIHGTPYVPWQMGPGSYDYSRGYCTHGSALFTTWHRPYLLALEQALFNAAIAIANTFTGTAQTQYLAAANRLRLPYWDWAAPDTQSYLPAITMVTTVTVTKPDSFGNPVSAVINNPLFAYNFLSSSSVAPLGSPFSSHLSTRRYPDAGWNDHSASASSSMQSGFAARVSSTYNAFLSTSYNLFSNRIEGVHDGVHGATGGGGDMSMVSVSAFDPIFWLHHCNVDRIMAMFQATQPSYWVTPASAVGTFARPVPPNTIDDTTSELYPFRRADGSWYKSSHLTPVSTIWGMKYGYAEVPCSYQTKTPTDLDTFTTTQINMLYAPGRPSTPGTSLDWNVRLLIDQAEIAGGFDIYVYGVNPPNPYTNPYGQGFIGSLSSMSMGATDQYKQSRIRFVDISLNSYLQSYGVYSSDPYTITSYLTKNLYYTIIANGQPCYFQDLQTAKIGVYSRNVYDTGKIDSLPYYTSDNYYYLNVTQGVPGGIKSVQDITYPVKVDGSREIPWAENNSTGIQS